MSLMSIISFLPQVAIGEMMALAVVIVMVSKAYQALIPLRPLMFLINKIHWESQLLSMMMTRAILQE